MDYNSLLESPTQLLSLARQTIVSVGFTNLLGYFSGAAYAFRGMQPVNNDNSTHINNVGLSFNVAHSMGVFSYQLGAGYLRNLADILYISTTTALNSNLGSINSYTNAVNGIDLHGKVFIGSVDASVKYIGAINSFSEHDVPFTSDGGQTYVGAKPASWDTNLGYNFPIFCRHSRIGIGYEGSKQAVAIGTVPGDTALPQQGIYGPVNAVGMPKARYYGNYLIDLYKWFRVETEIDNDRAYGISNGGSGKNAVTGILGLGFTW